VGAGSTWFNNTSYSEVPNSAVQLANPPGQAFTPDSDLLMYQIQGSPNLPSIQIGSDSPAAGWQVTMVGNGRDRGTQEAYWTSSWMSTSNPSTYAGYIWASTHDMRWGTNVISMTGIPEGIGANSETAFQTTFSANGSPYNAQGSPGDSGGAVFHEDSSGHWTLAGIMFAVNNLDGQPMGTSVFGDVTYSADLSVYRSEIYQIAPGLSGAVNNGAINGLDMNLIASEWGQTGTGANDPPADFLHLGVVNGLDIVWVDSNWLSTSGQAAANTVRSVPEPTTVVLAALGALALLAYLLRHFG
jgi:hypothetical protein